MISFNSGNDRNQYKKVMMRFLEQQVIVITTYVFVTQL